MIIIALMGIMRFAIRVKDILDIIDEALLRKGLSASAASKLAVGNPSLIKNMRQETGYQKRFNAVALSKLANVLDLEFYFGEEREQRTDSDVLARRVCGTHRRTAVHGARATRRLKWGFYRSPTTRPQRPIFAERHRLP
jgi:hypothetical protein